MAADLSRIRSQIGFRAWAVSDCSVASGLAWACSSSSRWTKQSRGFDHRLVHGSEAAAMDSREDGAFQVLG